MGIVETTAPRSPRAPACGLRIASRRQLGFTLIELLVSVSILLVGIMAVARLVPAGIQTNFRNRYDSTALIIAQRQLEQMLAQDITVGNPMVANAPYVFSNTYLPAAALGSTACPVFQNTPPCFYLGKTPPNFPFTAAVTAPPPAPSADGAILATLPDGSQQIDWTAPRIAGYWNEFRTPDGYIFETRWHVITFYGNIEGFIRPVGKRIIIATRGGGRRLALAPVNLTTMAGWRKG